MKKCIIVTECTTPCHYVQQYNLVNFSTNGAHFWRKVVTNSLLKILSFTKKKNIQAVITDDYCVLFHLLLFNGPTCQVSGFSRSPTINPFKPPISSKVVRVFNILFTWMFCYILCVILLKDKHLYLHCPYQEKQNFYLPNLSLSLSSLCVRGGGCSACFSLQWVRAYWSCWGHMLAFFLILFLFYTTRRSRGKGGMSMKSFIFSQRLQGQWLGILVARWLATSHRQWNKNM